MYNLMIIFKYETTSTILEFSLIPGNFIYPRIYEDTFKVDDKIICDYLLEFMKQVDHSLYDIIKIDMDGWEELKTSIFGNIEEEAVRCALLLIVILSFSNLSIVIILLKEYIKLLYFYIGKIIFHAEAKTTMRHKFNREICKTFFNC